MLRRNSKKKEPSPKVILDKFHEFIASSIWSIPITAFIEQQSTVFDRNHGTDAFEEYRTIHAEYKGLVDTLIECFCSDTNIPADKLQEALGTTEQRKMTVKQRSNLEPLSAAEDFEVFVPMMMRKNVELQLQALQMIEYMCGLIPRSLQIEEGETLQDKKVLSSEETERYVLLSVMRISKEDFDLDSASDLRENLEFLARNSDDERQRLMKEKDKEEKLVAQAIDSKESDNNVESKNTAEVERKLSEETSGEKAPRPPSGKPVARAKTVTAGSGKRPESQQGEQRPPSGAARRFSTNQTTELPKREKTPSKDSRRASMPMKESLPPKEPSVIPEDTGAEHGPRRKTVNDVNALLQEKKRITTADVEGRRKYLAEQRDKLLAMKQTERQKQMQEVSNREAVERPKTAKAARGAVRGMMPSEDIQAKRSLVEKIRSEVAET